jgi:hypothetical protein
MIVQNERVFMRQSSFDDGRLRSESSRPAIGDVELEAVELKLGVKANSKVSRCDQPSQGSELHTIVREREERRP